MKMNYKSERQLTICHQRGSENNPSLIIQGQWFKKLGFEVGDLVSIFLENNQLIIRKVGTWKDKKRDELVTITIRRSQLEKLNTK